MILDNLSNCEMYYSMNEGFKKGFEFIKKCLENGVEVGKYEIDGKKVYANVQEYNSKETGKYEAHKNYIDVQFIVSGKEKMYYEDLKKCKAMIPYNPEKDVEFYEDMDELRGFTVNPMEYAIFFPSDCHKPGMKVEVSEPVKKIILKVHI